MILTILNIVAIIALFVLLMALSQLVNSFGEILVKFVEQNQEYYKNQKHLVEKTSQLAIDMKKISSVNNEMKRTLAKIQESSKTLNTSQHIEKLQAEITRISSENSMLNSNINKLASEVSKLSNIKIKRD